MYECTYIHKSYNNAVCPKYHSNISLQIGIITPLETIIFTIRWNNSCCELIGKALWNTVFHILLLDFLLIIEQMLTRCRDSINIVYSNIAGIIIYNIKEHWIKPNTAVCSCDIIKLCFSRFILTNKWSSLISNLVNTKLQTLFSIQFLNRYALISSKTI